jgi:hypothetical protein
MNSRVDATGIGSAFEIITNFFSTGSWVGILVNVLAGLGVASLFVVDYDKTRLTAVLCFVLPFTSVTILAFVGGDTVTFINRTVSFLFPVLQASLATTAITVLTRVKNWTYQYDKTATWGIIAVLFVLTTASLVTGFGDRWQRQAQQSPQEKLVGMESYLKANTAVGDTVLTNKELGLSVNAYTGRKLVAYPVGHKSLVYDVNERERDLALMLYGNASTPREELFDKYSADMFYWDDYWIRSEFRRNPQGDIQGLFDPILVLDTEENRDAFDTYNVSYRQDRLGLNPNWRGQVPRYDVLLVFPSSFNATHPWDESLDDYLTEAWTHEQRGRRTAALYDVSYS